jgi:hypothetical protein
MTLRTTKGVPAVYQKPQCKTHEEDYPGGVAGVGYRRRHWEWSYLGRIEQPRVTMRADPLLQHGLLKCWTVPPARPPQVPAALRTNETDLSGKTPDSGQASKEQDQRDRCINVENQSPMEARYQVGKSEWSSNEKGDEEEPSDKPTVLALTHCRESSFEISAGK